MILTQLVQILHLLVDNIYECLMMLILMWTLGHYVLVITCSLELELVTRMGHLMVIWAKMMKQIGI